MYNLDNTETKSRFSESQIGDFLSQDQRHRQCASAPMRGSNKPVRGYEPRPRVAGTHGHPVRDHLVNDRVSNSICSSKFRTNDHLVIGRVSKSICSSKLRTNDPLVIGVGSV